MGEKTGKKSGIASHWKSKTHMTLLCDLLDSWKIRHRGRSSALPLYTAHSSVTGVEVQDTRNAAVLYDVLLEHRSAFILPIFDPVTIILA
jgi:hypothetical protein